MPRPRIPIGVRLFRLVLAHAGSATRAQISRAGSRHLTGKQIDQALTDCADLLEVTDGHYKGSRRPSQRFTLTLKGWHTAAALLVPDWTPRRLPAAVLQQWHAELVQEGDPYALAIARAFAAEAELERLKAAGWRLPKKRVKRPPPVLPVILPPVDSGVSGGFRGSSTPAAPAAPAAPAPSTRVLPAGGFCERCHLNSEYCQCKDPIPGGRSFVDSYYRPATNVQPTVQDSPSNSALAEKIKAKGYTVRNGKVLHGGDTWLTPEEWLKKEGHRLQS